ncbi:membrane-spanning 4-domains subfamily A member 8-like [Elgaria multicarinata webbii]|uniref:membrane-spanning 4-domains subfamily A member 8-like n=1 Tax=Elgaria multicarinata webbii TaxID=159646 RepID=UPI002FCCE344
MAINPVRMPTDMVALVPPNGISGIQGGYGIPPPVSVKYVQYVQCGQQFGHSSNPPQQALGKFIKRYAKFLGAIQIIIGLIEIIYWFIQIVLLLPSNQLGSPIIFSFMGGIFYIASGSVSVSAEKHLNSNLVNCSVGMNIASAVVASFGILGYILKLYVYVTLVPLGYISSNLPLVFSILLLLLTLLEFSIAVTVTHFGCRANCFTNDTAIAYVPCTITGENIAPLEDNCTRPTYVKIVPYMGV